MTRRILALTVVCLCLYGCDVVSSFKEGMAQSEEAAAAIDKQVGVKPQIGFSFHNGTFTSVTVQFASTPSAGLPAVEKVVRAAVLAAFKNEPDNLVISFVYKKDGA